MRILGWLGMALSVISYFLTVNGAPQWGIPIAASGCVIYGFYALRMHIWNLLVLQLVFLAANISGLFHIFS